MRRREVRAAACAIGVLSLVLAPLVGDQSHAQSGTATHIAFVDSIAASGDTASALELLEAIIAREPRNAAAWNRLGILSSAKARRARRASLMKPEEIDLVRTADSSLRRAVGLAPDSGRYAYDLALHLFGASVSTVAQSVKLLEQALAAAYRAHDTVLTTRAADELGLLYWRRYENVADRRGLVGISRIDASYLTDDYEKARNFLELHTQVYKPPLGEKDHARAVDYFREALRADPSNQRALRHLFAAFADQRQWGDMRATARERVRQAPWDYWGWLARGLASHRLNDQRDASFALDSAFMSMPDVDRRYFMRLSRILKVADSAKYEQLSEPAKLRLERLFWITADPLTLTPGNEYLLEFLSRVTHAELRWTVDDFGVRGADTDRGRIWIRYGPPEIVASFPAPTESFTADNPPFPSILWYYPAFNLHFLFTAPPLFGTASLFDVYSEFEREARATTAASFLNLPVNRHKMDSVSVQLARFRARGDSVDVIMVADVHARRLARDFKGKEAPVDVAYTLQDLAGRTLVRDSSRQMVSSTGDDAAERRAWRRRLRAAGDLVYRVEALQPDSMRAARALGEVSVAATSGFGLSDILVADRVQPGTGSDRWSDFVIAPSVGTFNRRQPVGLLWETYALAARDGAHKYTVAVTLERVEQATGAKRVALKILSGVQDAVGRGGQGDDRASITYQREMPARPVIADYLTLDLGDIPMGTYRITVAVTDQVSGQTASGVRDIRIVE